MTGGAYERGKEAALRGGLSREVALRSAASARGSGISPASPPCSERRDGTVKVALGAWPISVKRTQYTGAELAAMYDEAAERWHDRLAPPGYPRAYEVLFGRLLAAGTLRSPRNGGRVLDCGIGTAAFSLALVNNLVTPLLIEGVDLSPSMLLRACLNLDRAGIENRMHPCDVTELPFEADAFDAVIGAHLLEHLDDPFTGFSEMSRVLKPDRPMVVVANRRGIPDALLRIRRRHERIDRDRLERGMEEAGLTGIRAYQLLAGGPLAGRTSFACVGSKEAVSL